MDPFLTVIALDVVVITGAGLAAHLAKVALLFLLETGLAKPMGGSLVELACRFIKPEALRAGLKWL